MAEAPDRSEGSDMNQTNRQVDERAARRRVREKIFGATLIGSGFALALIVALMVHGGTR